MNFSPTSEAQLKEIQELLLEHLESQRRINGNSKRRNINPKVWGPSGWKFLDKIVEGYPNRATHDDQVQMLDFLTSLGHVLPCAKCRENYITFTLKYPPIEYVGSKRNVKKWLQAYKRKSNRKG